MTTHAPSGLPPLPEPDAASYRRAQQRLRRAFDEVRAACAWVDAPFGQLFLARTARGLCRLTFRCDEDAALAELERRRLLPEMAPARLDRERRRLAAYFAGREHRLDLAVDLRGATAFQRDVLEAACRIPFGSVQSYGDVARRIGRPAAVRAVGNALGKNPVAIVIPCHRVVAAGGRLGGYTGGLDVKRTLMALEGITLATDR